MSQRRGWQHSESAPRPHASNVKPNGAVNNRQFVTVPGTVVIKGGGGKPGYG